MTSRVRSNPFFFFRFLGLALLFGVGMLFLLSCGDEGPELPPTPPLTPDAQLKYHDPVGQPIGGYSNSFALLLGVSDYHSPWTDFDHAEDEFDTLAITLRAHSFEVEIALDPEIGLEATFERFITDHGGEPENRLLFYFVGHGHTLGDLASGYLVPSDAPDPEDREPEFMQNAFPLERILSAAQNLEAQHALFLFDSCLPNKAFPPGQLTTPSTELSGDLTQRPVKQFITACPALDPVPAERRFAAAVLRALDGTADFNRDTFVTGTELGEFIQQQLAGHQKAQYGKLADPALDRRGEFIFILPPTSTPPPVRVGWARHLTDMEAEFTGTEALDVPAAEMVEAWSDFLQRFEGDYPFSGRDEELRGLAEDHLERARQATAPPAPSPEGETTPPPSEGGTTPPPSEGGTTPPPSEGRTTPPPSEGKTTPPPSEGGTTPPPSEGGTTPPPSEGRTTPPPSEGRTTPPPSEGRTTPPPSEGRTTPPPPPPPPGPLVVPGTNLFLKVVGRSNNIPIYDDAGHSNDFVRMETLRSYFVFKEAGDKYLISSQQRGEAAGWVLKNDVEIWNTREGLKFVGQTFQRDRRRTVSAWESEVRLRNFASTRAPAFGPDYEELAQTRIGTNTRILPYPLLDTQDLTKEENYDAIKRKIHQVLIPAIVPDTVEVDMPPDRVTTMAGTVTFCVVFDATASMGRYARRFARTIESMLRDPSIDSRYAEAGFVFFRDLKDGTPHEIFQPEPLDRAMDILRSKINGMTGGDQKQEPVLDAVVLAKQSFLWSSGTVSNAKRIMIVVANEDANLLTVGLEENISKGLDALQVTRLLTTESQIPISVFALQAGKDDYGNLATVLSTLANRTGGEYFPADADERRITRDFADKVRVLVGERIGESTAIAQQVAHHTLEREDGGAIIALDVLNEELLARLKAEAGDLHIQSGGIAIKKAWLLEDENQDLYRKAILIDKEVLESLLRFFNNLVRSNLDSKDMRESTAQLLGALVGESFDEHMELQEMLEKRLGIHFTTPFLSFELERLSTLSDSEKAILRSRLESAAAALGDFMEINARRLNGGQKIWMPVNYLP